MNNRQENVDDSEEDLKQEEGICKTTDWTPWAECSASCGIGFTMRTRRFLDRLGRKKCPHVIIGIILKLPTSNFNINFFFFATVEKEKCMGPPCQPGFQDPQNSMCPVTDWSGWSPCSTTCGKGMSTRTRFLLADPSVAPKCQQIELSQQKECSEKSDCSFDLNTVERMLYTIHN